MSNQNIILDIFTRSFNSWPDIALSGKPIIIKEISKLKIDLQDLSLLESISESDLDEIIEKIAKKNEILCNKITKSQGNNEELYTELVDNFFNEINNTIDFVYNLIISKQLGG
tara:strand:- start:22821 stop:23159 length:339 start_codon:yes stop_codon:yes gene_type:complete